MQSSYRNEIIPQMLSDIINIRYKDDGSYEY